MGFAHHPMQTGGPIANYGDVAPPFAYRPHPATSPRRRPKRSRRPCDGHGGHPIFLRMENWNMRLSTWTMVLAVAATMAVAVARAQSVGDFSGTTYAGDAYYTQGKDDAPSPSDRAAPPAAPPLPRHPALRQPAAAVAAATPTKTAVATTAAARNAAAAPAATNVAASWTAAKRT